MGGEPLHERAGRGRDEQHSPNDRTPDYRGTTASQENPTRPLLFSRTRNPQNLRFVISPILKFVNQSIRNEKRLIRAYGLFLTCRKTRDLPSKYSHTGIVRRPSVDSYNVTGLAINLAISRCLTGQKRFNSGKSLPAGCREKTLVKYGFRSILSAPVCDAS